MTPQSLNAPTIGLKLLDEPHMAEIIVFILRNPGCFKTDVYRNVARGDRMNVKLDILEEQGIVEMTAHGRSASLRLTPSGELVAQHLVAISEIMARGEFCNRFPCFRDADSRRTNRLQHSVSLGSTGTYKDEISLFPATISCQHQHNAKTPTGCSKRSS